MNSRGNLISFVTLLNHELVRILRIWPQTLLPPVITTFLYYIIFGSVIGPRIGEMNGYAYIQFIMPGLVMMNIIDTAYINVDASFFTAKFFRSIEEMLITPMSDHAVLCWFCGRRGMLSRDFCRFTGSRHVVIFFTKITVFNWASDYFNCDYDSNFSVFSGVCGWDFRQKI